MFCGISGWGVRSHLVAIDKDPESKKGGVTAPVYKVMLEKQLSPLMQEISIVIYDNASIYTENYVKKWLREQNYKVMV